MKVKKKFLVAIFLLLLFNNIYSETVTITGTLKFENANLGNITLEFINSENKIFETKTNIYGQFSIQLKGTRYRIQVKDKGYFLTKLDDLIYEFGPNKNEKEYSINLNTEIKSSIISGNVIDENGIPISMATLEIKNPKGRQIISTDERGYFQGEVPAGFFTISATATGFYDGAFADKVEKLSSITNMKLKLKRIYYSFSGAVTDGISSLAGVKIGIYNSDNQLLSEVDSGENGYYEFVSFPSSRNYYLKAQKEGYKDYITENIFLESNLKNYNIIMIKK
ncbi:MAG: carboxypeptidase regulatory-like domain-containing protein [Fusobacteriaceae bacterium]